MYSMQDRYKIAATAQNALSRLRSNNSLIQESLTRTPSTDFSKAIFEEYDESAFESKVKIDSLFYKAMFKHLEESYADGVRNVLTNMFATVREIYEHVNIKPRIYGFNSLSVFNESEEILDQNASRMINDFLNQQYYSLTHEQREERYLTPVRKIAGDIIIKEGVNEVEAIEFAQKAVVMKDLIERINFPLVIRNKIEELTIDENYGKLFEQTRLRDLWEKFQEQCFDLSRIVATVI